MSLPGLNAPAIAQAEGLRIVWLIPLLIAAVAVFGAASYPTVEGWGLWTQWDTEGAGNYLKELPAHPDRPLHLLPSLICWLLPGDYGQGCMELGGLLAIGRGLLLWNLARLLRMVWPACLLLVTLGLFEPMWSGCGYERFHAAQAAFLLMLGALNLGVWHSESPVWWKVVLGGGLGLAGFLTYQGLFLVAVGAPVAFWVLGERQVARSLALILGLACAGYVGWYLITVLYFHQGYVGKNSEGLNARQLVTRLWAAVIKGRVLAFASLGITLGCLIGFQAGSGGRQRIGWLLLLVLASPLFGLIFFKNAVWLSDPERVWLAVMGWMVVVVAAGCAGGPVSQPVGRTWYWLPPLVACGLFSTQQALRHVWLQQQVLTVLETESADWEEGMPVRVVDTTDELGQLYTFLAPHHLNMAWRATGHRDILLIENGKTASPIREPANRVVLEKEPSVFFWRERWQSRGRGS